MFSARMGSSSSFRVGALRAAGALCLAGLLDACLGVAGTAHDYDGDEFLCDGGSSVCLSLLHPACSVILLEGGSIPPEAEQELVLVTDHDRRTVRGPGDLRGCVSIESPADALKYLRFFSASATVHLFDEQLLEVFRGRRPAYLYGPSGNCFICLPPGRWKALGLVEPKLEEVEGGYVVVRYAVRPATDNPNAINLFRVTHRVSHDGAVELLAEKEVPGLEKRERYGLAFPRYL